MRLRRFADDLPWVPALVIYWQLLGPVHGWGGEPAAAALAAVLSAAALSVATRLEDRRRAGVTLWEVPALLGRARAGELPADPGQRRAVAALVDSRWQRRRQVLVLLAVGAVAVALLLVFRSPLEDLEAQSAVAGALVATLALRLWEGRGLRRARIDLDPDIQVLVAAEEGGTVRGGGPAGDDRR